MKAEVLIKMSESWEISSNGEQIFDISFHPTEDLLAIGSITGLVEVFRFSKDREAELTMQIQAHESSCRGLVFGVNGDCMYTISSDMSWKALNGTGEAISSLENAHSAAINKIALLTGLSNDHDMIATGDDDGCVKVWDSRQKDSVMSWKLHEDFVSGFCYHEDSKTLLSVAGDACLSVYDIRKQSNNVKSDAQEAELLSVACIKNGRKVVCGTDDGVMLFFSWGQWGDCSDRYPGHPESVDSILKIDESTVLTGSSDGLIRVLSIHPNKILGVIGNHEDFPVEGLQKSHNGTVLGSYSHDNIVRLWDISMFADDEDENLDGDDSISEDNSDIEKADGTEKVEENEEEEAEGGEWEDMSEDSDSAVAEGVHGDLSSDEESDDEEAKDPRRKFLSASEKFFADI